MDALYLFKHSPNSDFEIRQSMRSVALHAPWLRKVWIFGERPEFLTADTSIVEHVPHSAVADRFAVKTPIVNMFDLVHLGALISGLAPHFLLFSDDFYLMRDLSIADATKIRCLGDLGASPPTRKGRFGEMLRRTSRALIERRLTAYNFETHTPAYFWKQWILDAYIHLGQLAGVGRFDGVVARTMILNFALSREELRLTPLREENSRFGFWGSPPSYTDCMEAAGSSGDGGRVPKLFFNHDDAAFGDGIRAFLLERFGSRSKYEK